MRYIDLKVYSTDIKIEKELDYNRVPITSGSINDIACRFEFSEHWEDLGTIIAVFKGSGNTRAVLVIDNTAIIPEECLLYPDNELFVGLIGTGDAGPNLEYFRQVTTEYISLGVIVEGASFEELNTTPTHVDLTTQLIKKIDDILASETERADSENKRKEAELLRAQEDERRFAEHLNIMDEFGYLETRVGSFEQEVNRKINAMYTTLVELIDEHKQKSVVSDEGIHNIRYLDNVLQIFTSDEWTSVGSN